VLGEDHYVPRRRRRRLGSAAWGTREQRAAEFEAVLGKCRMALDLHTRVEAVRAER
jgi:hypothetical protein